MHACQGQINHFFVNSRLISLTRRLGGNTRLKKISFHVVAVHVNQLQTVQRIQTTMSGSKGKLKSSVSTSSLDQWSRALNLLKNNSILDIDSEQDSEIDSHSSLARWNKEIEDDEMFSCKEVFSKEDASSEDDRSRNSSNSRITPIDPKADRRRVKRTPEISSSRASNDGPQRVMDVSDNLSDKDS